jgi:hypothetical protein
VEESEPGTPPGAAADEALIAESAKKSGVIWVRPGATEPADPADARRRARGVWHVWQDGSAYVLTGGLEQALPPLADRAEVIVRSKDKGSRLVVWTAAVSRVTPGGDDWAAIVPALLGKRLNLPDGVRAPERWARESVLYRLTPVGGLLESPEHRSTASHAAPPPHSAGTTPVPRPRHLFGRPAVRRGLRRAGD